MSGDEHASGDDLSHIRPKMAAGGVGHPENMGRPNIRGTLLGWSSLFLAILESLCVAAVALSGVRVLLVGPESIVRPELQRHRAAATLPIEVVHASGPVSL